MRYRRPPTPADVERQLRQEAGFGCARCGHPYIEYHHIVPFSEEPHFRPDDMIAVCGNCHAFLETQGRDRQYAIKHDPKNQSQGEFRGLLQYDKRDLVFRVGGNWYENTPVILQFFDTPLISCRLQDDQALVSMNVFNSLGRLVLGIEDSEVRFRLGDFWDFECRKNVAIVRSGPRDVALKLDFSQQDATVEGKLWAGGKLLTFGREQTNIGGLSMTNNRIRNCGTGIQIGHRKNEPQN
jgi:hypothetical protein